MISDRELDTLLVDSAGVRDADLPPLPDDVLALLKAETPAEPASVIAARQLVSDALESRSGLRPRRRRSRRVLVRAGVAVVAIAAAWTTAVVVAGPGRSPSPAPRTATPSGGVAVPTGGLGLVATQRLTFPLSLDPAPEGLSPVFGRFGGGTPFGQQPVVYSADYRSAGGAGFTLRTASVDPRKLPGFEHPQDGYADDAITQNGTVQVGGTTAVVVRGTYGHPSCGYVPSTPVQTQEPAEACHATFADLFWQRRDGQWVWIRGEDAYATTAAVVAVATSLVDRPQPVPLQVQLAPAGWTATGYEDNRGLSLASTRDPSEVLSVTLLERWRRETIDTAVREVQAKSPVQRLTVDGKPARLVLAEGAPRTYDLWSITVQLPDGPAFLLQAPDTLTKEQVLAIASQVTYTP